MKSSSPLAASELTPRQIDLLRLTSDGKTNKEIADALSVSVSTIKNHLNAILRKLDATDHTPAVPITPKRGNVRLG